MERRESGKEDVELAVTARFGDSAGNVGIDPLRESRGLESAVRPGENNRVAELFDAELSRSIGGGGRAIAFVC